MGIATKQLEAIFQEVNDHFKSSQYVSIQPDAGNPPEKYEVTYTIKGLHQNKKNEVVESTRHTIAISIPFGFPHFPPNCKPISPIFHPDFDQAAICIGDFWKKGSTVSNLIVHIAQMISGKIFSTDNAFNEEAVTWYKQHSDRLPFDSVDFDYEPHGPTSSSLIDSFDELEALEIDVFEDPAEETPSSETPDVPLPSVPQSAPDIDLDLLQLMAKQKRYYSLYTRLQSIPTDLLTPLLIDLKDTTHIELTKAKEIFQQGLDFELQGLNKMALEKFHLLANTVTDYPELEEKIQQAEESLGELEDFSYDPKEFTPKKTLSTTSKSPKKDVSGEPKSPTFFTEKPLKRTPILPIIIACSSAVLIGVFVFFFYSSNAQFKRAESAYSSCKDSLAKDKFNDADNMCNKALSLVQNIYLFNTTGKTSLARDIKTTLSSQKLRQGLAGMILVNGHFVPKDEKEALTAFAKEADKGDSAMTDLSWNEAKQHYQLALNIITRVKLLAKNDARKVESVRKSLLLAEVNSYIIEGKEYQKAGKIDQAVSILEKAKQKAGELDGAAKDPTLKEIEPLLSSVRFQSLRKEADSSFAKNQWKTAADNYTKAIALGKSLPATSFRDVTELTENKAKAVLYSTIQEGKVAFDNAQWDKAIALYESAIDLLKKDSAILKQASSEENRKKLARIMLEASIIRDKQDVARELKNGNNQNAIDKLESIVATIKKSSFDKEKYFARITTDVEQQITETKDKQQISEGIDYLLKNYKEIITKSYTIAKDDSLTTPEATFVKKMGKKLLYKLECTDTGQNSPLRIIIYYSFDPMKNKWEFYSNPR